MSKIMVIGDVHADWETLRQFLLLHNPTMVLSCGDFGVWDLEEMKNEIESSCPIYFCDGNHEDYRLLAAVRKRVRNRCVATKVVDNVYYMPRGTTRRIDDRNVLFVGGGDSIDKAFRIKGHDWFEEETLTEMEVRKLPYKHVDVIISHSAPDLYLNYLIYQTMATLVIRQKNS